MTRGFFIVLTTWWNDLLINASRTFLMSIFIAERWHVTDDRALHDTQLLRRSSSFVLLHTFSRISSKWSRFPGNQRLFTKNPFCHRLVRAGRGQTSFDSRLIKQGGPKLSLFWYVFDSVIQVAEKNYVRNHKIFHHIVLLHRRGSAVPCGSGRYARFARMFP